MKFRTKQVEKEAIQWTGKNYGEILDFIGDGNWAANRSHENKTVSIHTLEGTMTASIGDWIIKGVNGEFYPCKPEVFEKTYERIS